MADYVAEVTLEFEETDESFQINVRTVDKSDGTALNGATVSISGPVEKTNESSSGYAVFEGVPPGDYDVTGNASGYESASVNVSEDDFIEQ